MIIDIEPIIEQTKDEAIRHLMNLNKYDAMYVFRLENGEDYSRIFSRNNFDEFVPSRTVSEMIQSWEEGIKSSHAEAVKAHKSGLHPTFTDRLYKTFPGTDIKTGEYDNIPRKLDAESRANYKIKAKQLEAQFGKITFIKIV